jgi:hypothetical protein
MSATIFYAKRLKRANLIKENTGVGSVKFSAQKNDIEDGIVSKLIY